jgi:hypothetical protein
MYHDNQKIVNFYNPPHKSPGSRPSRNIGVYFPVSGLIILARFLPRKKPGFPLQHLGTARCGSCGVSAAIPRAAQGLTISLYAAFP